MRAHMLRLAAGGALLSGGLLLSTGGCAQQNQRLREEAMTADLGSARDELLQEAVLEKTDRQYLLQKLRTAIVTTEDGYAYAEDPQMQEIFDVLRTQGINDDKTVMAAVIGDGVNFWKGEPFEQALAYHYIAVHFAMLGDWGNARAAAAGALFPLKNFGTNDDGTDLTTEDLIKKTGASDNKEEQQLKAGYVVTKTDFALGYLMDGIANQRLGMISGDANRLNEANENFDEAAKVNSRLSEVTEALRAGHYNTLLLVDYGVGPMKYGRGPDRCVADFKPMTPSDGRELEVSTDDVHELVPVACDVNAMAHSHQWKNLEDVRRAKSYIGTALLAGGAGVAAYGGYSNNSSAAYTGLAMMLVGVIAKASAAANVEYCEVIPQRIYVAPLNIDHANTTVTLQLKDRPETRFVLSDLRPPRKNEIMVRNVRMVTVPETEKPAELAQR